MFPYSVLFVPFCLLKMNGCNAERNGYAMKRFAGGREPYIFIRTAQTVWFKFRV